jgi:surface protein
MTTTVLTNENIQEAVDLWFSNEVECIRIYGRIVEWDVSHVTNMKNLFNNREIFNENISHWNVSNVTDMSSMFSNASSFNQNILHWNV